ncbi:MAG: PepSY-associated TM helix domain-containing protein [Bryobacteraceae bacterium]
MNFRKILFWCHLCTGSVAGVVILTMSVTGVLLGFERQINAWADNKYHVPPLQTGTKPISIDELRSALQPGTRQPPSVTVRANPSAPIELSYGRERTVFVDPYTGKVLGDAPKSTRVFFAATERLHRALGGAIRNSFGHSVTGFCNLLFLGLVISGIYLWFPKQWTSKHIRPAIWFRKNLSGRPRDWNWHNAIGFWCAMPLFFIVLSGVIMSYAWANNLLYQLTGSPLPAPPSASSHPRQRIDEPSTFLSSDELLTRVKQQSPGWKSISFRMPTPRDGAITFTTDAGNGGQPQKRSQLTVDRKTGIVIRTENFDSYNLGRKLRLIARFLHTGEVLGLPGQIIATLASLGATFLVWTGLSLALRRLADWKSRRERTRTLTTDSEPLSV